MSSGIFMFLVIFLVMVGISILPVTISIISEKFRKNKITTEQGDSIFKRSLVVAILILVVAFGGMIYVPPTKIVLDKTYDIYALNDNVLVKGDRYYITADNKLTFFRDSDEEDGGVLDSVSADKSIIFETDEQPRIEIYKDVANSKWKWVNYVFSEVNGIGRNYEYRLYVPKGTIVKEFKMDLE